MTSNEATCRQLNLTNVRTFNRVGKADEKLIHFQHLPSLVDVGVQRVHCVSTVVQLVNTARGEKAVNVQIMACT